MSDNQERARRIVERAIADLINLGMPRDAALAMLAVQSAIRMESQPRLAGLAIDIIDLVDDRAQLGEIAAAVRDRGPVTCAAGGDAVH
jgi:hypothetical protein